MSLRVAKAVDWRAAAMTVAIVGWGMGAQPADARGGGNAVLFDEEFDTSTAAFWGASDVSYAKPDWKPWPPAPTGARWQILQYIADINSKTNPENYFILKNADTVTGGALHISADKTSFVAWPTTHPHTYDYTSGWLWTNQYFTHGYFEMRAKIPLGQGYWPALWMKSQDSTNEIDILEGQGATTKFASNIYDKAATPWTGVTVTTNPVQDAPVRIDVLRGAWSDPKKSQRTFETAFRPPTAVPDLSSDYHIYAVNWQPSGITFYFDGVAYFHTNRTLTKPMHVILDLSLGGAGGHVGSATPAHGSMDIDYVRVLDHAPAYLKNPKRMPKLTLGPSNDGTYDLPSMAIR